MNTLTVILPYSSRPWFITTLNQFIASSMVEKVVIVHGGDYVGSYQKCEEVKSASFTSSEVFDQLIDKIKTEYFLMIVQSQEIELGQNTLERMLTIAEQTGAGMVYSDHYEVKDEIHSEHPVNECQLGSIRDNFDFGPLLLFSMPAVQQSLTRYGKIENVERAGLYDLRLKVSLDHQLFHIQEYLYTKREANVRTKGERQFDYVDSRNRQVQIEMEKVATNHLKNLSAYMEPNFEEVPKYDFSFPVEASVVIPIRNRLNTIGDAVKSVSNKKPIFPLIAS